MHLSVKDEKKKNKLKAQLSFWNWKLKYLLCHIFLLTLLNIAQDNEACGISLWVKVKVVSFRRFLISNMTEMEKRNLNYWVFHLPPTISLLLQSENFLHSSSQLTDFKTTSLCLTLYVCCGSILKLVNVSAHWKNNSRGLEIISGDPHGSYFNLFSALRLTLVTSFMTFVILETGLQKQT